MAVVIFVEDAWIRILSLPRETLDRIDRVASP